MALWALAKQYGKDVAYSGPLFKTMKVSGNKAILSFEYAEDGLMTPENAPVKGLSGCGSRPAFLSGGGCDKRQPAGSFRSAGGGAGCVRYGFCNFFRVNLYNQSGLPAVPFRTDTWEQGSYARWFADSEMMRFPQAYRLDHGKRLFFGYARSGLLRHVADVEGNGRTSLL